MQNSASPPEAVAAEAARRAKERNILRKTALDMVRSLAVIGVVVVGIYWFVPRPDTQMIPEADLPVASAQAEQAGDVPVVVPVVPKDWRATSARREPAKDGLPATWHIGYLTGSKEYAGVKMTREATDLWFINATTEGDDVATPVDIDGVEWATWVSRENRVSLVHGDIGGPAIVVSGTATRDELAELATAVQRAE